MTKAEPAPVKVQDGLRHPRQRKVLAITLWQIDASSANYQLT